MPESNRSGVVARALRAAGLVPLALVAVASAARAQFPDFDLRIEGPKVISGPPSGAARLRAMVVLRSTPPDLNTPVGARAWSLSLGTAGVAKVIEATTDATHAAPAPRGLSQNGYEKTELTYGEGNEGVVSAVILSLSRDVYLPRSGDANLLQLLVECTVPESGCVRGAVAFADGRVGSGQPVKNVITYGEGVSRRDDGGPLDNDADREEAGEFFACKAPIFIRGDTSDDGAANLTDSVLLLEHLFTGRSGIGCLRAADLTDDDRIDLGDAIYLLNHLFASGPPPAAPYPECWTDPSPGTLPCAMAKGCG